MILDTIVEATKRRVSHMKAACSVSDYLGQLDHQAIAQESPFPFERALRGDTINFICEVKKASPSKGVIAPVFPYVEIAKAYEEAGAAAISVLTEPDFFQGSGDYLQEISHHVQIPLLCKDFIIDEVQVYAAKAWGASAILLIASILSDEELRSFIALADSLNMSCLVEAHTEEEVDRALRAGARILGVNNRNLKDFTVDIRNCLALRARVPKSVIFVAESGLSTAADIEVLRAHDVQGALIGESLMRAPDKVAMLQSLYGTVEAPVVKCCGIRCEADVAMVNELLPDYVGFVLAPSRREVTVEEAAALGQAMDRRIKKVGVMVKPTAEAVVHAVTAIGLDVVQIHGKGLGPADMQGYRKALDDAQCDGVLLWQAIAMASEEDVRRVEESPADAVVVDYYDAQQEGGTGCAFPWEWVRGIEKPLVLAGGITPRNVRRAVRMVRPYGVDASSCLEGTDGYKDKDRMKLYIEAVRSVGAQV